MNSVLSSAPSGYPVTLSEAKAHLRVLHIDDDTYINNLIAACTSIAEGETQRRFITQTWTTYWDEFPSGPEILIPFGSLQSVTFLKYKDGAGTLQTLVQNTDYVVDTSAEPARIALSPSNAVWPTIQWNSIQAVQCQYVCGYGAAAAVPMDIKQAILILIGQYYEHREDIVVGASVAELPRASKYLLHPYKLYNIL